MKRLLTLVITLVKILRAFAKESKLLMYDLVSIIMVTRKPEYCGLGENWSKK
jgi:hypothetical protein